MAKFSNRCCAHYGFGSCHAVLALSTAFRVTSILRMRAASARFGWLSFGGELAVAGLQRALVGLEAGEDGHAEGVAGLTAAALENAAVLAQAAVLGEGGEADEGRDLAAVECFELRQLGDEGVGEDRAAAGQAGKQG